MTKKDPEKAEPKKPTKRKVRIYGIDSELGIFLADIEDYGDGSMRILSMKPETKPESKKKEERKAGRCVGCRYFIFDPNKGHYADDISGWGECTHPEASKEYRSTGFFSRCEHFERSHRQGGPCRLRLPEGGR